MSCNAVPRLGFIRLLAASLMVLIATPAAAEPEEIQIYMDEMNAPGDVGLDTHVNYAATGTWSPDYPGQQSSLHRLRITPEFSYGLTSRLEAGLYLPLATVDAQGRLGVYGIKGRLKYLVAGDAAGRWWYGANLEIGHVARALDINPWNAELKGIVGTRRGRWTLAANVNLDAVVSGPVHAPVSVDVDSRIAYAVTRKLTLGLESYNGMGDLKALGHLGQSEQTLFLTMDHPIGRWDLNLGIGRGYAANPDRLIVKAIIGVPIDRLFAGRRS